MTDTANVSPTLMSFKPEATTKGTRFPGVISKEYSLEEISTQNGPPKKN